MRIAGLFLSLIAGLTLFPNMASAQDEPEPKAVVNLASKATWMGTLKVREGVEIRLVININTDDKGKRTATFDSPDQNSKDIPVDLVSLDDLALKFAIVAVRARFEGKLNKEKDEAVGQWIQGGTSFPFTIKKLDKPLEEPKMVGEGAIWEGRMAVQGGLGLRMIFHIGKTADGKTLATFDSPDQSAFGLKVSDIKVDKDLMRIEMKSIGGIYEGKLNDKGDVVSGTWSQAGSSLPLELKRVEKISSRPRPQTPKPPFDYKREEVIYRNEPGKTTISGELTIPTGQGPFPAVVLISGSGAQDRDETILEHKPFFVLADDLTKRGLVVLRFDDRGVGKSTGDKSDATLTDVASDVVAGLEFLKTRPEVDKTKLGLIGHSEGGTIAPIVATKSKDVSFIVLLAGTGVPGFNIVLEQTKMMAKAAGVKDSDLDKPLEVQRALLTIVRDETDPKALDSKIKLFTRQRLSVDDSKDSQDLVKAVEAQESLLKSRWFRDFLAYDPRPVLARVTCPVLALIGEKDIQVLPEANLRSIKMALENGGNDKATVKEVPGLNHLFQTAPTGALAEYPVIDETIAPTALKLVGDWIVDQTKLKK